MYPIDLLHALPYFKVLERPAVETLARQMSRHDFGAGESIFFEGDASAGMWLIERGRVKVFKLNPEGEEHILRFLGPGNTFNDIAAFDGGPNPANTAALVETTLWLLPTDTLHELIRRDARVAERVVRLLAGQVRSMVGQVENLALYSVTIRLARFLLKQAEDPALSGPGVTRAAIAAHLATKPETVSRSLRSLEESGAIQFDRHRIIIVREDLLKAIAAL
jgi:CRP/FNR family transcriptional regulator